jgi:hypothetical protein
MTFIFHLLTYVVLNLFGYMYVQVFFYTYNFFMYKHISKKAAYISFFLKYLTFNSGSNG